jgi:formyl-CoA transferase
MVGAYTLKQLQRLLRAIDRDDLAEEVTHATAKEIGERRDEFAELLTNILATKTADEWEAHFNDAGVPAARVRRIDEALQHPQTQSRQVLQQSDTIPETGLQLKAPVAAFNFAHGGPTLTRPAPRLGEHSHQVLSELGYSDDDISQLAARGTVYLEEYSSTPK